MVRFEAEIAAESDVKEGQIHKLVWNQRPIILFKKESKIYAYLDVCTHVGGPLFLQGNKLLCQWHNSVFDAATGKAETDPAPMGSELIPLSIEVKNGKIYYVYPPEKPRGQWHIGTTPVKVRAE